MPPFIGPQLCTSVERPPVGADWVHEIKFDGYRIQLRVEDGKVTLKTRKGLDWTSKFGAIATVATALPNCIIDGEIVALDHRGSPNFAGLQAALSDEKTDDLIFFAFDLLFLSGKDLRQESLVDRKKGLKELIDEAYGKDQAEIRYVEHFETGGDAVLKSACRMSLEGIVSKLALAPYASGRTDSWTKAKCRAGHEVVIGGWNSTAGKFAAAFRFGISCAILGCNKWARDIPAPSRRPAPGPEKQSWPKEGPWRLAVSVWSCSVLLGCWNGKNLVAGMEKTSQRKRRSRG